MATINFKDSYFLSWWTDTSRKQVVSSIQTKQGSSAHLEALFPFVLFQNTGQQHTGAFEYSSVKKVPRNNNSCVWYQKPLSFWAALHC